MTRTELLAQLLTERYGPARTLEVERPLTPDQIRRRRRAILVGKEESE
jgi:hypothetical protein